MPVTKDYKSSNQSSVPVSVDFITDAVKESVQHLDGLITARSAKNLISKIDKLIGEHLNEVFIRNHFGQTVADASAQEEQILQNLIAFRAHIFSKKTKSLPVSVWKEYVKKYVDKNPVIVPPVCMVGAGPQAANVVAILTALVAGK